MTTIAMLEEKDFDQAMAICGISDQGTSLAHHDAFVSIRECFLGLHVDDTLRAVSFGYPMYILRERRNIIDLDTISVDPDFRGQGLGHQLLMAWEQAAWQSFDYPISFGSTADEFYIKHGYTCYQYCLESAAANAADLYDKYPGRIVHCEKACYPNVRFYVDSGKCYDRAFKEQLLSDAQAVHSYTLFDKSRP